jgi:cell division protein FtsB
VLAYLSVHQKVDPIIGLHLDLIYSIGRPGVIRQYFIISGHLSQNTQDEALKLSTQLIPKFQNPSGNAPSMNIGVNEGLSWLGGALFFLWAVSLVDTSFIGALVALTIGLALIPPGRSYLRKEHEIDPSRKQIIVFLAISIFLVSAVSGGGSNNVQPAASGEISKQEYEELQSDYQQLQEENQQLEQENQRLRSNSVSRQEHQQLREQLRSSVSPPYVVAEDRSFTIAFVTLAEEPIRYSADSETLEAQIQTGTYMRQLSVSQMEYLGFNGIASKFKDDTKYQQLGDYGRYYQLAPFVVESNFETISSDIYGRYNTDERRVREVWNFVTQINTYSTEIEETPRLPLETLLLGGGDCEDTAILAASMLEAMPTDWDVQLVYMDADRPQDPQNIDHVMVYVDTGEYRTFIETTSNEQMSPYSEVDGYYVDV